MVFDNTVTLGQVLLGLGFLISGVSAFMILRGHVDMMRSGLERFDARLDKVETSITRQNDILVDLARKDERMNAMRADIRQIQIEMKVIAADEAQNKRLWKENRGDT